MQSKKKKANSYVDRIVDVLTIACVVNEVSSLASGTSTSSSQSKIQPFFWDCVAVQSLIVISTHIVLAVTLEPDGLVALFVHHEFTVYAFEALKCRSV